MILANREHLAGNEFVTGNRPIFRSELPTLEPSPNLLGSPPPDAPEISDSGAAGSRRVAATVWTSCLKSGVWRPVHGLQAVLAPELPAAGLQPLPGTSDSDWPVAKPDGTAGRFRAGPQAATTQALIREVLAHFGVKPGAAPRCKQPGRRRLEFLGTVTILRVSRGARAE